MRFKFEPYFKDFREASLDNRHTLHRRTTARKEDLKAQGNAPQTPCRCVEDEGVKFARRSVERLWVNWNFTTHKENAVQIVGLDIGYSNLKVAFGEDGKEPALVSRPAGAAPSEHIGQRIMPAGADEPLRVLVDGKEYVAGCSHDRLENWARELHKDYTSTDSYRALFNAGLLLSGMTEIDRVVTGLPTSQYFDDGLRKHLAKTMKGEHQVTPKKKIIVKDVKIVPQPLGGFVDYLSYPSTRSGVHHQQGGLVCVRRQRQQASVIEHATVCCPIPQRVGWWPHLYREHRNAEGRDAFQYGSVGRGIFQ